MMRGEFFTRSGRTSLRTHGDRSAGERFCAEAMVAAGADRAGAGAGVRIVLSLRK